MSVGDNIKRLRLQAGLTQEELANKLGVARSSVTQWERGWSQPRMGMIVKIARFFNTSNSAIVDGPELAAPVSSSNATHSETLIPLTTLGKVHAGPFSDESDVTSLIDIPASLLNDHPNARAVIVEGDCMDVDIPEGTAAVYDPDLEPVNGSIVIVENEHHEALIRQWYRGGNTLMLVANSHKPYDDILISGDTPIRVLGTVIHTQSPKNVTYGALGTS